MPEIVLIPGLWEIKSRVAYDTGNNDFLDDPEFSKESRQIFNVSRIAFESVRQHKIIKVGEGLYMLDYYTPYHAFYYSVKPLDLSILIAE